MNAEGRVPTKRFEDGYFVVRDGLRLHYRDYPGDDAKPPILCLHGLTRNSKDFAAIGERYSPRFRVLALDVRGRGESDHDPQPMRYNPLTYAGDAVELLDHLGVGEAIFIGTSLGGLVTMTVAATAPQRIAASVLNDVGPELTNAGLDRIRTYVGRDVRFDSWDEAADRIAENNKHTPASYSREDWIAMARRVCREADGKIGFDYDMAIAVPFEASGPTPTIDMWPLFQALGRKPLLIIRGEVSDLLGAEALEKMKAAIPDMRSVVVPGVGHAPELNEPEALAALDDFLDSLDR